MRNFSDISDNVMTWAADNMEILPLLFSVTFMVLLMAGEAAFPRKKRTMTRKRRWSVNILIIMLDSFIVRLMGPIAAITAAAYASKHNIGLLNWLEIPAWIEFLCALILLDLAIYFQHVASHNIPILWRFHKVHHSDRDIDVTTAMRFHPGEIIFSMLYKCICVLILGPSIFAVIIFAALLNLCAMFNHSNMFLPLKFDKILRLFLVTPDMHRVHHSTIMRETNSNYGFSIALWDRLFGTYIEQPAAGHDDVVIGLEEYQSDNPAKLVWTLKIPFGRN